MSSFFNRDEFLIFFDEESVKCLDTDKYIAHYDYRLALENKLSLNVNITPLEQTLSITLNHSDIKIPLFDVNFYKHDVERISLNKEKSTTFLNIYKMSPNNSSDRSALPNTKIMLKPTVSLMLDL